MNEEQDENRIWWYQGEVEDEGPYTIEEIIQFKKDNVINNNSQVLNKKLGYWYMYRDIPFENYQVAMEEVKSTITNEASSRTDLVGLGGWLILIGIGLVAAPLMLLSSIREFSSTLTMLESTAGIPNSFLTLLQSMNFFNYLRMYLLSPAPPITTLSSALIFSRMSLISINGAIFSSRRSCARNLSS